MSFWLIFLSAAVLALLLTGLLRRYALARRLMDIPNERSSHTVPTPRGGGVAIVLTFLVILPLLGLVSELPAANIWALLGAGGAAWVVPELFWGWVILLGAFVVEEGLERTARWYRFGRVGEWGRVYPLSFCTSVRNMLC